MNSYELSRKWFDWCFENPDRIKPNHTALYFFAIEHCNRLGWKHKFGLPSTMAMEALGIKSYNTYINTFNDLTDFGFISIVERSKNQYSSNIIALSNFNKALDKALDKALIKHTTKQSESTGQSIDSINKQETINNKQGTKKVEYSNEIKNFTISLIKKFDKDVINSLTIKQKWGWVDCVNKLTNVDKYTFEEIEKAVTNAREDDFWKKNFLTLLKLRKKDKDGIKYIKRFLLISNKNDKNDIQANRGYVPNL